MAIEVLFFGSLVDTTAVSKLLLDDMHDTKTLKAYLEQKYPALRIAKYFEAVNGQMIQNNTSLRPGDTVALMPPFSGG